MMRRTHNITKFSKWTDRPEAYEPVINVNAFTLDRHTCDMQLQNYVKINPVVDSTHWLLCNLHRA